MCLLSSPFPKTLTGVCIRNIGGYVQGPYYEQELASERHAEDSSEVVPAPCSFHTVYRDVITLEGGNILPQWKKKMVWTARPELFDLCARGVRVAPPT